MTTETQAEFAKRLKVVRSYVTALKHADRLVMTESGAVDVEASIARIQQTSDQTKQSRLEPPTETVEPQKQPQSHDTHPMSFHTARTVKEKYAALSAKLAYEQSCAKLLVAKDVVSTVTNAATLLRSRLETLPNTIAPQIVNCSDEQQILALIAAQIEHLLADLAANIANLCAPPTP